MQSCEMFIRCLNLQQLHVMQYFPRYRMRRELCHIGLIAGWGRITEDTMTRCNVECTLAKLTIDACASLTIYSALL